MDGVETPDQAGARAKRLWNEPVGTTNGTNLSLPLLPLPETDALLLRPRSSEEGTRNKEPLPGSGVQSSNPRPLSLSLTGVAFLGGWQLTHPGGPCEERRGESPCLLQPARRAAVCCAVRSSVFTY